MKDHYGCPVQGTIKNAIGGKWKTLAIWRLGFAPKRFAPVRKLLPGISEKVLTAQLRQLEADGIVKRADQAGLAAAGHLFADPRRPRTDRADNRVLCKSGARHLGIPPNLPRYPQS